MSTQIHRIPVSRGGELHVQTVGEGRPLVFIPGWTFPSGVFRHQYEVPAGWQGIFMDPRGSGRSSATLGGNTYADHAQDLAEILRVLALTRPVLVAWSYGANTAYAFLREYGVNSIAGLVILDESPKPAATPDMPWGAGTYEELGQYIRMLRHGHQDFMREYIPSMFSQQPTDDDIATIIAMSESTQPFVATALFADGAFADWRSEAILAAEQLPYWHVVSEPAADAARAWMKTHAPGATFSVYPGHIMFWESAGRFNRELDNFLARVQP